MPQPKKPTRTPTKPAVADLSPLLDEIIRSEIQKALARTSAAIAEQVRAQIVAALTGAGAARKPARIAVAKVAKSATAKAAKVAKRGGAKGAAAKRASGRPANEAGCNVTGCARPHRSKGYCAAHYQSARKHGWPTPCPAGFEAPVAKRGRPAKAEAKTAAAPAK